MVVGLRLRFDAFLILLTEISKAKYSVLEENFLRLKGDLSYFFVVVKK